MRNMTVAQTWSRNLWKKYNTSQLVEEGSRPKRSPKPNSKYIPEMYEVKIVWKDFYIVIHFVEGYWCQIHTPVKLCSYAILIERQPNWKTTSQEDNITGRWPHRKTTSQEDDHTGRQPHRKTTSKEDDHTGRWPHKKTTWQADDLTTWRTYRKMLSHEDDLTQRRPHRKTTS